MGDRGTRSRRRVLVTGATGNVGGQVARQLRDAGVRVRALVRDPAGAALPDGVEAVYGDLRRPETVAAALQGVDATFLVWPFLTSVGAAEVVAALSDAGSRVVYLSSLLVRDGADTVAGGVWGDVERLVEGAGVEWTFLRAGGLASNAAGWAEQIIRHGAVSWIYGYAIRSPVDPRDVAAVAVRALVEDRHVGARYVLTGPEALSQVEQARIIGEAVGRRAGWDEMPEAYARELLLAEWQDAAFVDRALDYWATLCDEPEPVTTTVQEVTGVPARTFREWAAYHVAGEAGSGGVAAGDARGSVAGRPPVSALPRPVR